MSEKPTTIEGETAAYEHPAGPMTQGEADAASVIGALEALPEGGEDIAEATVAATAEIAPVLDPTKTKAELEAEAKEKNAADAKSLREAVEALHDEDAGIKNKEAVVGAAESVEKAPETPTENSPANLTAKALPLGIEGVPATKQTKDTVKDAKQLAGKKPSGLLMRGLKKVGGWIGGGFMALFGAAYALYEIVEGKAEKKKDDKKK